MNDSLTVQCGKRRETFANDGHGDTGLYPVLRCALRCDDAVDVFPKLIADPMFCFLENFRIQQLSQIDSVYPFHDEHSDFISLNEVLNIDQIIMLDSRYRRRDIRDAFHRC